MLRKLLRGKLIYKLLLAIVIGIVVGRVAGESVISVVDSVKNILGQLVFFCVPLIILGFITPAIISLKENAGKMLTVTLAICYISSVGAALFSMVAGYSLIPHLNIVTNTTALKELPEALFKLNIDPIIPVMTALVASIMFGLAVLKTEAKIWNSIFEEFNNIILFIVENFVIRILPLFIACTFATLAYEGDIIYNLPVFLKVIVIVIVGHVIWLTLLYTLSGVISKSNPLEVLKYYGPAYMTAVGTMSSAATLSVSLAQAKKSPVLDPKVRDFAIPLCANTHLCGSVLTEVFFVMTVSQVLYGHMPALSNMILFALLLGIFAIAAPGVPGGTVMASLGLIIAVLGFDAAGTGLMISIFALQDSFGTACNVTGDGAIALMVTGIFKKQPKRA